MLSAGCLPQVWAEACISLQARWEWSKVRDCPNHIRRTKSSIKKRIIVRQSVQSMFGEQTFTQLRTGFKVIAYQCPNTFYSPPPPLQNTTTTKHNTHTHTHTPPNNNKTDKIYLTFKTFNTMYCCIACLGCTDGSRMCACVPALCCWCWIIWCMHVSCPDSDVHSCFELRSALSQSSWIRCYIRIMYYYYY